MESCRDAFFPFKDTCWLNCASEGPLPRVSYDALEEAFAWKANPAFLTQTKFVDVPLKLKDAIGRLLHVSSQDVVLGNSATYGLHLLAHGFPFSRGDQIILMQNDFPSNILPWLYLEEKGVQVIQLPIQGPVISFAEIEEAITSSTRLICFSHVHSFSGHSIDVDKIGKLCRDKGICFVLNITQSAGNMPINLSQMPVDAITCSGFKWLLGPFGTGFCWMTPQLRDRLHYHHAHWGSCLSAEDLKSTGPLSISWRPTANHYDVFGKANFFNFVPLTASIEYLLGLGLDNVFEYNQNLLQSFLDQLDRDFYEIISPEGKDRSCLIVFSNKNPEKNSVIFQSLKQKHIHIALWKEQLRVSPHIFNTEDDIHCAILALNQIG